MELKIEDILPNQNVKGVVHVGIHHGQEWSVYKQYDCPVIFIEPCSEAFKVLVEKFKDNDRVTLINCAMGASEFFTEMYVEKTKLNMGASNSVLKPKKHLEQYPQIPFTEREEVKVMPLDRLTYGKDYNILVIDTQGYELEVLKGAVEALKTIDCIFTEVNRAEMYENCAMVEELDEFLKEHGFTRTQADWRGGDWGDALYIKGGADKNVLVISCDKYKECWNPMDILMKKYIPLDWPVILVTDGTEGEPFKTVKGGGGTDYGWVENLKRAISNMTGVVLFLQEDFFPTDPWDLEFINYCADSMKDSNIGCFRLYPCPGPEDETVIGEFNGITYGEIHKGELYRVSCQAALWRTDYLTGVLDKVKGTAANFELDGMNLDLPGKVYSVLRSSPKWPAHYLCTGIIRGKWNPDSFKLFKKEGIYGNGFSNIK